MAKIAERPTKSKPTLYDSFKKYRKVPTWHGFPPNRYIKNNPFVCSNLKPELIVVVNSAIGHLENRELIRQSWGSAKSKARNKMAVMFIFGMTIDGAKQDLLEKESKHYNDIIQVEFLDTYHNLTKKTIAMLNWVKYFCGSAKYVLKCDDDILINPDRLLVGLRKYQRASSKFFFCAVRKKIVAIRKKDYKWYISESEFKGKYYPTHCSGIAYSFTMSALGVLLNNTRTIPPIWLEDIYISGMLAPSIAHIHSYDFIFWTAIYRNKCTYKKHIALHGHTIPQLKQIYSALQKC
jgi:hypothetical protein